MRVNVTGQPYDYVRPWQKKAPFSKRGLGAVLSQGRVLVTADLVDEPKLRGAGARGIGEKTAANVEVIDYEANLALLEPTEKKFLDGLARLSWDAIPWWAIAWPPGNWNRPARSPSRKAWSRPCR